MQFPLTLSWAVTIHKCQGITLHYIVVDMKGKFNRGQAYVAFSRVKSLQGLYVINFNQSAIKTDSAVTDVMNDLRTKQLPVFCNSDFFNHESSCFYHYWPSEYPLLFGNTGAGQWIQCIKGYRHHVLHRNIPGEMPWYQKYLDRFSYSAYRMNKENVPNRYGVMICISNNLTSQGVSIQGLHECEICATLVKLPQRNLMVCALYMRPALTLKTKLEELKLLISQLPGDSECVLIGNFNHDLSADENQHFTKDIEKMGFYQYVTEPPTEYGSILDHVYYNGKKNIRTGVLDTYFSDHDCVTAALELWKGRFWLCFMALQTTEDVNA